VVALSRDPDRLEREKKAVRQGTTLPKIRKKTEEESSCVTQQ
jgi:hypothetical protein